MTAVVANFKYMLFQNEPRVLRKAPTTCRTFAQMFLGCGGLNKNYSQHQGHHWLTTPPKPSVGGVMKNIVYGKSVNPVKKINAATRRHARRKAEAIQRELVASRIDKVLGLKPEKRKTLTKIELACKRKPAPPLDLSALTQYQEQITLSAQKHMKARYPHRGAVVEFEAGSCCLENVALFQAGYRNSVNLTAR